ncbi:MAG TPA: alcohol dehydrogenase catalytic domain-containing protein, partial [Thermoleophilia bacterium]|nr:alcohol dehydrogenase catalytic domain-containing protein [Thermoleophilia bacterium]
MRAIRVHRFGGPEVLQLDEVPELGPPRAGEVLVRLRAAGVNPVETYVRSGQYAQLPDLPYTPGSDGAGVVEAVGDGVDDDRLRAGADVYTSGSITGTYAEAAICAATQVHPLPPSVSHADGAALGVPYV